MQWIDIIRKAVLDSGLSDWQLHKATGLDYPNLRAFTRGRIGLSLASAQRVAQAVGLDLVPCTTKVVIPTTKVVPVTRTDLVRDTTSVFSEHTEEPRASLPVIIPKPKPAPARRLDPRAARKLGH